MSEEAAPERIAVLWSPEARADLRAIDRETAMQILHCIDPYLASRTGDVKKLKPPLTGFRLRCPSALAADEIPRGARHSAVGTGHDPLNPG